MKKQKANQIHQELIEAVKAVGEKHNVAFELNRIRYNDSTIRGTVKGTVIGEGDVGSQEDVDRAKFIKALKKKPIFNESDFGTEFKHNGKKFRLVGLNPRAKKYPVIAENLQDGKRYKMPATQVPLAGNPWA